MRTTTIALQWSDGKIVAIANSQSLGWENLNSGNS